LEKDRTRRYATASDLGRDVERYLRDEPVEACPPSLGYRLGKVVRRYRGVLAAAAAMVLLLVAGVVVSTWQAVRATKAEAEAREAEAEASREAAAARQAEEQAQQEAARAEREKARAEEQLRRAELLLYTSKLSLAQNAFAEGRGDLAVRYLEECPWNLRGWEHRHLWTRFNSKQTLQGHTDRVTSVAFSADGRRIVSGSDDQTVKVWDAERGQQLLTLQGHKGGVLGGVTSVAISADGRRIASGSEDGTVKVWDAERGQQLLTLKHTGWVTSVAFSPDGRRIFAWDDTGKVLAWSSETGQPVDPIDPPAFLDSEEARFPDGFRRALVLGGNDVYVADSRLAHWNAWPLPDAAERRRYHSEKVQECEANRQWFAAAFHLRRLLLDDPNNAELKRRLEQALKKHAGQ
ncbi:MAG TPA: hypothetical protein VNK04_07405, partial [Gemmataceae bacterium]|nr:hypothetical protein [Gemmataceae bacterium]